MNAPEIKKIMLSVDLFELIMQLLSKATYRNHSHEEISNFINQVRSSVEVVKET